MSSAITELWEGIIEPNRPLQIRETRLKHALYLTEEQSGELLKSLNEAQKRSFVKYCDYKEEYSLMLSEQAFSDGFSLGMRLAAEALVDGRC